MKTIIYTFLLIFLFLGGVYSQTGIGTTTPDPSAQLDVTSSDKGLLTPRMTKAQRTGIASPATGLLVYQTDVVDSTGFYYFDGTEWIYLFPSSGGGGGGDFEGFSASKTSFSASSSTQFSNWSVASPFYGSAAFNNTTGSYTVPETGKYRISATINYSTTAAVTVSLGAGVEPSFVVRRTSPMMTDLVGGNLPILNVNVALVLTLRAVLGTGQVALSGDVELNAGDEIGLFYEADGLTINLDLGGGGSGITWSVTKLD
ncbi:hypothetical protein [Membranihabitans maritimus]|uniref:hypothetical protein n=1 Tax=Membranihabitans maritimus TaxID=2904244 RepID=UPI001F275FD0|nr:hypothetical protein [Membranihabitans maritimus]